MTSSLSLTSASAWHKDMDRMEREIASALSDAEKSTGSVAKVHSDTEEVVDIDSDDIELSDGLEAPSSECYFCLPAVDDGGGPNATHSHSEKCDTVVSVLLIAHFRWQSPGQHPGGHFF